MQRQQGLNRRAWLCRQKDGLTSVPSGLLCFLNHLHAKPPLLGLLYRLGCSSTLGELESPIYAANHKTAELRE